MIYFPETKDNVLNVAQVRSFNGESSDVEAFGYDRPSVSVSVGAVYARAVVGNVLLVNGGRFVWYRYNLWARGERVVNLGDGQVKLGPGEDPVERVLRALQRRVLRMDPELLVSSEVWTPGVSA